MAFQLGDANKVEGRLKPVDSRGNPVSGVQNVVFSVSDTSLATVGTSESTPDDPLAFSLAAAGPLGSFQFQYSFDGDPGEGVVTIQGAADVEIVAGLATGAAVEFGEQVPQ